MKNFKLTAEDIKPLTNISGGCIATDRITVEGYPVHFMYRAQPRNSQDTGWRFFSSINEDDTYLSNTANSGVYTLNTIANYDQGIIPHLDAPIGSVFERDGKDGKFLVVDDFEIRE